jgi:hypothetical protein
MTRRTAGPWRPLPPRPFLGRIILVGLAVVIGASALCIFAPRARAECNANLMKILAYEHSKDMARRNSLDHAGFEARARRGARAENVAYGYKTLEGTMEQWRRSPPHAANLALPGCRGVASARSASGRIFWTLEIGE